MKNTQKVLFALVLMILAVLVFTPAAEAQTNTIQTTLSTNVTTLGNTVFSLVSTSGMSASSGTTIQYAYVDQELVRIDAIVNAGIQVTRGQNGTLATVHASQSFVYAGPAGDAGPFLSTEPAGRCVRTAQTYQPKITARSGTIWECDSVSSTWRGYWLAAPRSGRIPYHGVMNADYTARINDEVISMITIGANAGTGVARTITLPAALGLTGKQYIIKDESGAVGTNLNTIIVVITGGGTVNGGNTTATITTGFGSLKIASNGAAWFVLP